MVFCGSEQYASELQQVELLVFSGLEQYASELQQLALLVFSGLEQYASELQQVELLVFSGVGKMPSSSRITVSLMKPFQEFFMRPLVTPVRNVMQLQASSFIGKLKML